MTGSTSVGQSNGTMYRYAIAVSAASVVSHGWIRWSVEHWSGRLRVLTTPCSATYTYVALMGPESDNRASAVPIDKERWSNAFPGLSDIVERIGAKGEVHHTNVRTETRGWVSGRVAMVGDAAHGQPPNLGQGAGLAIAKRFGAR